MDPIRVMIVDDHPVTREGLHAALDLANDVLVVGEADSGEAAVEKVGELTPDIVFMDVRMPGMSGIEATKAIRDASPDTRVILFTVDESRASIAEAIQAGVSGYLLKDADADELVNAARLALEGKAVIHPALTRAFIEEVQLAEKRVESPPLSKRAARRSVESDPRQQEARRSRRCRRRGRPTAQPTGTPGHPRSEPR